MIRTRIRPGDIRLPAIATAGLLIAAAPAHAATMSASPTAPPTTGEDIANYGTVTGTDKWWNDAATSGRPKGQTFTTGSVEVLLKAVTYQVTPTQLALPTKNYVVRVGTVSGTTFTEVQSETATQTFTWNGGEYMTWTLDSPVLLAANTDYGFDVGMTGSTSSWQSGIPYLNRTDDDYPGGTRYMSGTTGLGLGDSTMNNISGDMVFHIDLQHPMAPSPESGTTVLAGNVILGWTNFTPNEGNDVWVDVWFGSNPGALTKVVDKGLNTTSATVTAPGANTYYWRVDSYLNGAATGTPLTGTQFTFVITDSDGDGFPDDYEMAHTSPPSATGLNPGDDLEPDGLTNLQEYQRGTDPNDSDSDNDDLDDGPEVAGAGSRPPTDPNDDDSDDDGLKDGVESNSGSWLGVADTGTNPTLIDTDLDGLGDGVETNTGSFGSAADTGTHPLNRNSDGDNAEDWYEVAASFTDPTKAADKPNIPYPLPDPGGSAGATDKPVKVYIMSGQSNMVGFGYVNGDGPGTLATMTGQENKFPNLVDDSSGGWTVCSDVLYRGVISDIGAGPLKPDVAGTNYGPELGFGYVMGYYHEEPVLLIKSCIGNRSISWDFLPPGSPQFIDGIYTYAGYGDSPNRWETGTTPVPIGWYAGKQWDECFMDEGDWAVTDWADATFYPAGAVVRHNGTYYACKKNQSHTSSAASEPGIGAQWSTYWSNYSAFNVTDILDHFASEYPLWAAQGFEIAGYVWWQGHKDQGEPHASRYELNMVNFIKEIRNYYENRYPDNTSPDSPFVLATIAFDGWNLSGDGLTVANGQLAVSGETGNHPEFAGNVKTIEARGYWRDSTESPTGTGYHYNHNAETYLLTGDSLGRAMIGLLDGATAAGDYETWAGDFPGSDLVNPDADLDGDGLTNNEERIWGSDPTTGSPANPFPLPLDPDNGTFNYTRRDDALTGLSYSVWTSPNLQPDSWTEDTGAIQIYGDPDINGVETVSVTVSPARLTGLRLFVRVRAAE